MFFTASSHFHQLSVVTGLMRCNLFKQDNGVGYTVLKLVLVVYLIGEINWSFYHEQEK